MPPRWLPHPPRCCLNYLSVVFYLGLPLSSLLLLLGRCCRARRPFSRCPARCCLTLGPFAPVRSPRPLPLLVLPPPWSQLPLSSLLLLLGRCCRARRPFSKCPARCCLSLSPFVPVRSSRHLPLLLLPPPWGPCRLSPLFLWRRSLPRPLVVAAFAIASHRRRVVTALHLGSHLCR